MAKCAMKHAGDGIYSRHRYRTITYTSEDHERWLAKQTRIDAIIKKKAIKEQKKKDIRKKKRAERAPWFDEGMVHKLPHELVLVYARNKGLISLSAMKAQARCPGPRRTSLARELEFFDSL